MGEIHQPGRQPNRLIDEKSPYLLQHAHNPVDWYPWGEDAFDKARQEDKPIFLSIGYSTCHWCHVMERESFENEEIAQLMNELFVNIKVDREERPDVDRVYMTTVQVLTGHGGWPLSVWLTPDLQPFFGGTYFPPESQYGRPGFPEILRSIGQTWSDRPQQIRQSGAKILKALQQQTQVTGPPLVNPLTEDEETLRGALDTGFKQLSRSYDAQRGGFSPEPKFPRPATFNFLLRHWARRDEAGALEMTLETLRRMWAGGMYDHLGGGFHRYSVDTYWRVPHFEKMLYDQAQLAISYLEAYQITQETFFAAVARDVLDYVLRDMTDEAGGFYSAEDADSATDPARPDHKEEGAFYMWTQAEVEEILGEIDAPVFIYLYGIAEKGNSISDPTGELGDRNVLYVASTFEQASERFGQDEEEVRRIGERGKRLLLTAREKRPRPQLDDKIIASWNGLMISAFVRASQVLGENHYLQTGRRAAEFLVAELYDSDSGTLKRRYRDGEARHPAHLEDYAFLTQGLIDLYEAGFERRWLEMAVRLTETQIESFWDEQAGGFFDTSGQDPSIILRTRETHDGAEPSGNSIAACNLLRLSWILGRQDWRQRAESTISSVFQQLTSAPVTMPQMLATVDFALDPPRQIVIVGSPEAEDTRAMLRAIHKRFLPDKIVLLVDENKEQPELGDAAEFYDTLEQVDDRPTAYVCENYACRLPTNEVAKLEAFLDDSE
jgi:uncharacterized protein YyaL (SSP411 family)